MNVERNRTIKNQALAGIAITESLLPLLRDLAKEKCKLSCSKIKEHFSRGENIEQHTP
jgi:hypothetical protein